MLRQSILSLTICAFISGCATTEQPSQNAPTQQTRAGGPTTAEAVGIGVGLAVLFSVVLVQGFFKDVFGPDF